MSVFTPEEITELLRIPEEKSSFIITPYVNSRFFGGAFIALGIYSIFMLLEQCQRLGDHLLVF